MGRRGWEPDGGAWTWRQRLFAWEEESLRECSFLLHNIVLQDNAHDSWRWHLDPVYGYSVRASYRFITENGDMLDRTLVDDVWHKSIPSKVSLLVWRLLRNRVPTKDNLVHRGVLPTTNITCMAGCGQNEIAAHLFLHCNFSCNLWYQVWKWIGISSVHSGELRQHFTQFTKMAGMPKTTHFYFRIIWFASVWVIWKERNNRVFKHTTSSPFHLLEQVKLNSFLWLKSKQTLFVYNYQDWWKHPSLCMGLRL